MTEFTGFPQGTRFTPVPDLFMTALALDIDETFELKVSLYIFWLLNRKKGYPRFVTLTELLAEQTLAQKLTAGETPGEEILRDALNRSVARGTFLRLSVEKDGNRQDLYFANTEAGRKAVEEIKRGRLELGRPLYEWKRGATGERTPDIFTLYQDNIGLLTPIISDELLEAEKTY
ncbi:MAG: DNA replication protein DnaD, partial [Dehalococcoidia bacterium]|nr:DNA replication protein DnaD [Dehalococcoidia bacterium]